MGSLINKYLFTEIICKFKGHTPSLENERKMISSNKPIKTICEICHANIEIEIDKKDDTSYLITEI